MLNGGKKFTMRIDEQLHREVKAKAALKGKNLSIFVSEAIKEKMAKQEILENFLNMAIPFTKAFFKDDPGAILTWEPGGFFHGFALYSDVKDGQNINFILLEEGKPFDPKIIYGRKVVVVSDSIQSGKSFEEVKRKLLSEFGVKEVKIVVYEDFSKEGKADLALKKKSSGEHLNSLLAIFNQ